MSTHDPRPWYVLESLCDGYGALAAGNLKMLQTLKVLRGITLNAIIATVCIIMVLEGGDPTLIGSIALIGLMVINGVELTDYLAAKQALEESKRETIDDE